MVSRMTSPRSTSIQTDWISMLRNVHKKAGDLIRGSDVEALSIFAGVSRFRFRSQPSSEMVGLDLASSGCSWAGLRPSDERMKRQALQPGSHAAASGEAMRR
jgi:hypothetical protein